MAKTFRKSWPATVPLILYAEDFEPDVHVDSVRALPGWFTAWKKRHVRNLDANGLDVSRNRRHVPYDYRRNCVKFAHKVAALCDAAERNTSSTMIWADADVVTHADVDELWLRQFRPHDGGFMSWLDRRRVYPECGFMVFSAEHDRFLDFFDRLRTAYETDAVFKLGETHDSYVIQKLVAACVSEGWFPEPSSLSGKHNVSHHPFTLCELGSRLDHAKGRRKVLHGRTPVHEAWGHRKEAYWQ